jgi:uncharacterized protein (TIGR03437 family)
VFLAVKEEVLLSRLRLIALIGALACLLSGAAFGQSISVVSGNGQVLTPSNFTVQAFVVKVSDANGVPAAGVSVNWTVLAGTGIFLATGTGQATTTTDQDGMSSIFYTTGLAQQTDFTTPYFQSMITASPTGGSNSVTFYLTQVVASALGGGVLPQVQFVATIPDTLQGAAGTRGSSPIQVIVSATNGSATRALPNAAVQLLNFQDPATGAAIACVSGGPQAGANVVLTDANGNATCTPVFGGVPGNGQAAVAIGGVPSAAVTPFGIWQDRSDPIQASGVSVVPFPFTVTPGSPGSLKLVSGNNQSGNAGQTLPTQLIAEVDNASGQPLAGVPVTWTATPASAVNFVSTTTTSDANGRVTANVAFTGTANGSIQVTAALASDPTKTVTFTLTAVPLTQITGFTTVSGSGQSAVVGTQFAAPLIVQVTTSAGSAANIPVQFQVTSGSASLSATTVNTDANGRAQVNVTAGTVTGATTVTATVAGNTGVGTQTFSLTVLPQAPTLTSANFVNGADQQVNSLSPCSIGAILTAPGTLGATGAIPMLPGFPIPGSTIKLTIGGAAAPILSVGTNGNNRDEIRFQVPCSVAAGSSVPGSLTIGAGGTTQLNLNIQAASPGIFQAQNSDGVYRAVLVRPDGSFVSLENPARRGESVVAYVTGLGATNPTVATPTGFNGAAVPPPSTTATQINALAPTGNVIVGMAGQGVPLNYARLSEDLTGVFVVSFQIPGDLQTGNDVTFSIGIIPQGGTTAIYSATTKVPVQ